jgi:hypothetical protein
LSPRDIVGSKRLSTPPQNQTKQKSRGRSSQALREHCGGPSAHLSVSKFKEQPNGMETALLFQQKLKRYGAGLEIDRAGLGGLGQDSKRRSSASSLF